MIEAKNSVFEFNYTKMSIRSKPKNRVFEFESSIDEYIRVLSIFNEMVFDPSLEPLQIKNRQMDITNLRLMKNQAVTKVIQMFPPKPRRIDGRRPASTRFEQGIGEYEAA